jgi:hypothetical protein
VSAGVSSEEIVHPEVVPIPIASSPIAEAGPLDTLEGQVLGPHIKKVFGCWVVLFGIVGAQMSWVLRPFLGTPGLPFEWFRPRGSNFFEAVWKSFVALFG